MRLSARFFRFGAVCAALTVLTTLIVHVLPNAWGDVSSFEQQVELRLNPAYLANRWGVLLHCVLVIMSMLALGAAIVRREPAFAVTGFLGFLCFGFTEILRTSISIFAVNRTWRAGYAAAADDATRERFRSFLTAYSGVNDALFFLFDTAFLAGLICYALGFLKQEGRMSRIGVLFSVWAVLTLPPILDAAQGRQLLGPYFEWVGPWFLPLARAYVAFWLWRNAPKLDWQVAHPA